MGLRGPKTQPTRLKEIRGNPGHRPFPVNEPKVVPLTARQVKAQCPQSLSEPAREWWEYYADIYAGIRIIAKTDLPMLAQLATATAERLKFEQSMLGAGPLAKSAKTGAVYVSPLYNIVDRAREREFKLLREFGSSPSSRTSVHALGQGASHGDPWDNI